MFRSPASSGNPGFTDLGVWNIFANPDIPNPQSALTQILCAEFNLSGASCTPDTVLPMAIAFFKTPSVRDPGQSNPYMHNGSLDTIPEVLELLCAGFRDGARRAIAQRVARAVECLHRPTDDVTSLTAFLNALNEDYR